MGFLPILRPAHATKTYHLPHVCSTRFIFYLSRSILGMKLGDPLQTVRMNILEPLVAVVQGATDYSD